MQSLCLKATYAGIFREQLTADNLNPQKANGRERETTIEDITSLQLLEKR